MKVGVFDSGLGGLSVANAVRSALPEAEVIFVYDSENFPYATKEPEKLLVMVEPYLQGLVQQDCAVIIVACNTVSTTLIAKLRARITVPLVAMEPMIKPAAEQTKSKLIAVCATPTTLKSQRYAELKRQYAQSVQVLEPDCSDWALMIEDNEIDHEKIKFRITEVCEAGADVIVLGCTHYHWIEEDIKQIAARYQAAVIQPEEAVIRQLNRVLAAQTRRT